MGPSITCPKCLRTSHHPMDIREGYCGACHDWTSHPAKEITGMSTTKITVRAEGQHMTLDELSSAVQRAHRLNAPGDALVKAEASLEGLFDMKAGPGAFITAVHLTLEEP